MEIKELERTERVVALKSKDGKLLNYIFEFKVSKKKEELESDCQRALVQIEEKKYGSEIDNPVKIGKSLKYV